MQLRKPLPSLCDELVIDGTLRVFVDSLTGEPIRVECAKSTCPADLMFSRGQIARALEIARQAWMSTADVF